MRYLLPLILCLASAPASAQSLSTAPPPAIQSTNAIQSCGPFTTTLNGVGQSATMPAACNAFATYFIHIVTTPGQSAFVGSFSSTDGVLGSGRRLIKNGVAALQVSSETLVGTQGSLDYRTTGGSGAQTITVTSYTSGSMDVTLYASTSPTAPFINGAVSTTEEAALRQGKAFTASTGLQSVTAGQYQSLLLSNPAGSGVRLVIPPNNRIVACNNPSNAALPSFQSRANVTTNAPTTPASITRRGGSTGTSAATVAVANSANLPDTNPATANPVGLPFFASYAVPQDRTLEPGNTITITIAAVGTGLAGGTPPACSVIVSWFEESLN